MIRIGVQNDPEAMSGLVTTITTPFFVPKRKENSCPFFEIYKYKILFKFFIKKYKKSSAFLENQE